MPWAKDAAEKEREQTERLDGLGLRMIPFFGDLLRQNMNEPENADAYEQAR